MTSKLIKFNSLIILFSLLLSTMLIAHGGGLDQSGGHNCYVGSCAGSYHYHRGSRNNDTGWIFWLIIIAGGIYLFTRFRNSSEDNYGNQDSSSQNSQRDSEIVSKTSSDDAQVEADGEETNSPSQIDDDEELIPKDWLNSKHDFEALNIAFGNDQNPDEEWSEWKTFKKQYKKGDEIWEYDTPSEYWDSFVGQAGFVIVRDGKVIAEITTMEN